MARLLSRLVSLAMGVATLALVSACSSGSPGGPTETLSITAQPRSQTIAPGSSATLTVSAGGSSGITYQWFVGAAGDTSSPIQNATASEYTTPALVTTTRCWIRVGRVLVNQRRAAGATCGSTAYPPVAPLAMNANLRLAAQLHSQDMATNNYFSHTSLDGRTFVDRIRAAGYAGSNLLGENIAAGQGSPASVVNGWMGSTGHCQNIMSSSYRAIGVGYAFRAGSPFGAYWTQTFGGS